MTDERPALFRAGAEDVAPDGRLPSMLTTDEKALYRRLGRSYRGRGQVIEFGPWLGSGTYQLCTGLSESGRDWRLTVFDRFVWSPLYARRYPKIDLAPDASFRPLFERNLAPFTDHIRLITSEINDLPINLPLDGTDDFELLFIDAPKSWRMLWHLLHHLGPRLLPGARLLFQDFLHITSRQLIWLLASIPSLKLTELVESGTTAVFVADGPIADLGAVAPRSIAKLSADDLRAIWARIWPLLPEARLGEAAAGLAVDLLEHGDETGAWRLIDEHLRGRPWEGDALYQIDRLIRADASGSDAGLSRVAAYARSGRPA